MCVRVCVFFVIVVVCMCVSEEAEKNNKGKCGQKKTEVKANVNLTIPSSPSWTRWTKTKRTFTYVFGVSCARRGSHTTARVRHFSFNPFSFLSLSFFLFSFFQQTSHSWKQLKKAAYAEVGQ